MRIVWSPTAKNKITEILEYISEDNPETNNTSIRELVVHENYGIIYELNPDVIEILTVRHFRQNFSASNL